MIPHVIHQMFINPVDGTGKGLDENVLNQCNEWKKFHPNYQYHMWSLEDFFDLCAKSGQRDVADAVRVCRFPAMQVDIARLFLLKTFGGFWVDLKLYPLGPFLDLLSNQELVLAEHFQKEGWRPGLPCSAFLGAQPDHPFLDKALTHALSYVAERNPYTFLVAGPAALEKVLQEYNLDPASTSHYYMLPCAETWNKLFKVGGGSYNGPGDALHWSKREQKESPYADEPAPAISSGGKTSSITRDEIIAGYRFLLGRDPNEREIAMWAFVDSVDVLRHEFFKSDEFRSVIAGFGFVPEAQPESAAAAGRARRHETVPDSYQRIVVLDGDDIAASDESACVAFLKKRLAKIAKVTGAGSGGAMLRERLGHLGAVRSSLSGRERKPVILQSAGSNDLVVAGIGADEVLAVARQYAEAARGAGFKVIVSTLLPRMNFVRHCREYNALLRAQWTGFADGLADFAADPVMGDDAAPLNPTLYVDGVHPTEDGGRRLAAVAEQAILRFL